MEAGSIVRVSLPESNGKIRSRPALLLKRILPHNDWLLCVISGSLHNEVKGLDIIIDTSHPNFAATHLKYSALIRVGFLYTVSEDIIEGTIGKINAKMYEQVVSNLSKFIKEQ